MGILNVTPDSFSDGGKYTHLEMAINKAEQMVAEGADIIDIGGESTRPGAADVSVQEEIDRVIPLVTALKCEGITVSVDTSKPEVMEQAIQAGADMINDVRALSLPGAMEVMARYNKPVCLMHMQGQPRSMQNDPQYDNVVEEVYQYLEQRIKACVKAGINAEMISIDPGFGFGKNLSHNVALLNNLDVFKKLQKPLLVGMSRKRMVGEMTGKEVEERLAGSLAVALIAMQNGANIVRVHDVKETCDVKKIFLQMQ